jgi:hypothetical protein
MRRRLLQLADLALWCLASGFGFWLVYQALKHQPTP